MTLTALFSIQTTALTILGYPLSYLELFGTFFNLASVWLVARKRIETWPVGLVGGVLFLFLFYQIQLYSDSIEQVYYLITGFYGWAQWARAGSPAEQSAAIRFSSARAIWLGLALTAVLSLAAGWGMARIHLILPQFFPTPAAFPFLDALTTLMSFTATILMANRRSECWGYWIAVDIIGVGLYAAKGVYFIALLYAVYLVLACIGLVGWLKAPNPRPSYAR